MWSVLILIAGLVIFFITNLDSLGLALVAVGGVLAGLQILWFIFVAGKVRKVQREVFNDKFFDRFDSKF